MENPSYKKCLLINQVKQKFKRLVPMSDINTPGRILLRTNEKYGGDLESEIYAYKRIN